MDSTIVEFMYLNHKGKSSRRVVRPIRLWFGVSPYHANEGAQWLLEAFDLQKQESRDFAMSGMLSGFTQYKQVGPFNYMEQMIRADYVRNGVCPECHIGLEMYGGVNAGGKCHKCGNGYLERKGVKCDQAEVQALCAAPLQSPSDSQD